MPKTAAAMPQTASARVTSIAGKTAPKKPSKNKVVQIATSAEFFAHGEPVLYRIGGNRGPHVSRKNSVQRTVNLKKLEIFANFAKFVPLITHIECGEISGAGEGNLTTYACPTLLRPLELFQLICQMDESKRDLNGNDYADFLMTNRMTYCLTQVEDILSSPDKWETLNREGKANVFAVHQDGKLYFILAYRVRKLWFVKDSRFLQGRGFNPDALYHFRNPVPEPK